MSSVYFLDDDCLRNVFSFLDFRDRRNTVPVVCKMFNDALLPDTQQLTEDRALAILHEPHQKEFIDFFGAARITQSTQFEVTGHNQERIFKEMFAQNIRFAVWKTGPQNKTRGLVVTFQTHNECIDFFHQFFQNVFVDESGTRLDPSQIEKAKKALRMELVKDLIQSIEIPLQPSNYAGGILFFGNRSLTHYHGAGFPNQRP